MCCGERGEGVGLAEEVVDEDEEDGYRGDVAQREDDEAAEKFGRRA